MSPPTLGAPTQEGQGFQGCREEKGILYLIFLPLHFPLLTLSSSFYLFLVFSFPLSSLSSLSPLTFPSTSSPSQRKRLKALEEGWEYARLANLTYHITEHRLDFARRRRWLRKLVATDLAKPPIFRFEGKKEKVCVCVCVCVCVPASKVT